ncbi:calcium uptake protein 3, mitochondrial-like [Saccoglossus kowalevskii]
MATAGSRIFNIIRSSGANLRRLSSSYPQKRFLKASLVGTGALCAGAGALVIYICRDIVRNPPKLPAVLAKEKEKDTKEQDDTLTPHLSKKEERFQEFASCEYDGQMFMTPQDFLESVTQEEPRARIGRVRLTEKEVTKMLHSTPTKRKASSKLFRQLNDKGKNNIQLFVGI